MKISVVDKLLSIESNSIKETMQIIDTNVLGVAFIVNESRQLTGIATDGDIRRAIIKGINVESSIKEVMNSDPIIADENSSEIQLLNIMKKNHIKILPLMDEKNTVKDFALLDEIERSINGSDIVIQNPKKHSGLHKILIIGGGGYIGSVLTRKLLNKGYKVKVLDILLFGDESIQELYSNPNFEFVNGDIRNIQTVVNAVKDVDAVAHLAAMVGDPACALDAEETIEINYLAAKMIAEVCKHHQINRFVFASTCSVYGASDGILTENSKLNPVSLYAETKLKSEQGILSLVDDNFSPCILRQATIYGASPRMRFDLVVNILTARAINEGKISIFGGSQWRPNVHVEDAAEAFIKCLEAPIEKVKGEIYNVGSNEQNYQIYELGDMVKKLIPNIIVDVQNEEVDKRDYHVSFDKISKNLGYSVQKTVEDGIKEIKTLFEQNLISDYNDPKYSNYKQLVNQQE